MEHISSSRLVQNEDLNMEHQMYQLMVDLFPVCRSITGNGVRQTLRKIKEFIPLEIHNVPSGTKVFDWEIPNEWNIRDAYVMDEAGNRVIDFNQNNLHVVGYSVNIDRWISLSELQDHLYSLEDQPEAIPYVTSYYKENWGFCISHQKRAQLQDGKYHVFIDSDLKPGYLNYGELIIPGVSPKEVFLSTYICHPSMANNELSGPVLVTYLAKWLAAANRKYTYRIIFIPETIGSITYLSRNLNILKSNVIAGFNVTCVGDEHAYSFVPSRYGNTYADKVALNILRSKHPEFIKYSYLDRGSDERQYCSPGVDLPVVSLMRSKYGTYPEYHTSLDNLQFVTPQGLKQSYELYIDCLQLIEANTKYLATCYGEPQLGKRQLYPDLSIKMSGKSVRNILNFLAYADGYNDIIDISNNINVPVWDLYPIIKVLTVAGLIKDNQ